MRGHFEGLHDHLAAERDGKPRGFIHAVHSYVRRPVRRHAALEMFAFELVERADISARQPQAREAAAVRGLLARGPAEQPAVKALAASASEAARSTQQKRPAPNQ